MRYSQYKTINELSESLKEALVYVANTKNYALLEDCLMAMTAISEALLNESGKEANKIKTILSDMYKILEVLDNPEEDISNLATISEDLANECKTKLKYKLRILFVAELGSKWDSMKSVYEAFLERDDCDIDVVLEPIFRATKLPNGETKAEIIYDDWLTPLGINHIPYKQYDMATIQPDITFISQPYESVTIPMFWPENIAKYSKLVYLPYFMAMTLRVDSAFTSLLKMNIERYSWKIICQSQTMKDYYSKYASRKGENVLVTGLPKWDYAMSLSKGSIACPIEWEDKLLGKTVILYNTHFERKFSKEDIENRNELLVRLLNREDVAVIWRPHPMTEVVLKLFDKNRYEIFKYLKDMVKQSKNIVLDENVSYAYAFVWSDILFDSRSSLMTQYILMDKPIVVTSYLEDEKLIGPTFSIADEGLFDYKKLIFCESIVERNQRLDEILSKKDGEQKNIDIMKKKYFVLADGCVGSRICKEIVESFLLESD